MANEKRIQYTISFQPVGEMKKIKALADEEGRGVSDYVRNKIMIIVEEEELLKEDLNK